jgi:SAM-dependent methyltransferase
MTGFGALTLGAVHSCASHTEVEACFLARALRPEARVLDAGCGRKTRLAGYRDRIAELVGVDLDAEAGTENLALDRFVVADLCSRLPFEDAYFDLVYANFVVEHLDAPEAAFHEWRRVLRPDGALVLLTSNRASPSSPRRASSPAVCASSSSGPGQGWSNATSFSPASGRTRPGDWLPCSRGPASPRSRSATRPPSTGTPSESRVSPA